MSEVKENVDISMTDFIGFVSKAGSPKLTHVKNIKGRGDYDPRFDFWRALRRGIKEFHESGKSDKKDLDSILVGLTDQKKINTYPILVENYKSLLGRKEITYFEPVNERYHFGEVCVRVNPELGLKINDQSFLVKLHFKKEPLSIRKIETILLLMKLALTPSPGTKLAIWDLANKKVISRDEINEDLLPLLWGEASNFESIWKAI